MTGDGRRVASVSTDQTLRVWDLSSDEEPRARSGHAGSIIAVAVSGTAGA